MDIVLLWSPVCAILITIITGIVRLIHFIINKRTDVTVDKASIETRMIKEWGSIHSTTNSKNTRDIELASLDALLHLDKDNSFTNVVNDQIKNKTIRTDTNLRRFVHEE